MILLLHAFPLNSQMYSLLSQALYDAGEEVYAPNFPGFGGESGEMASLKDVAQTLLNDLPEEEVVGVGLSMGGYVLMQMLALAPERFKGVILANTRMEGDTPEGRQKRLDMAEKVLKEGTDILPDLMLKGLIGEHPPEDIQDTVRTLMKASTAAGVAAAQRAMADRPDSSEILAGLQIPVLVIAGTSDTLIPFEAAKNLAQTTRGQLVKLPTAHLSNLLDPEGFTEAVLKFVEELG